MFSFLSCKEKVDLVPFVRRIIDLTTPNKPVTQDTRADRRFNRTLPCVVCLCDHGRPILNDLVMGITQDISDYGIGLITLEPIEYPECFVSLWPERFGQEEPIHFRCVLRSRRRFCHGFWAFGATIEEVVILAKSSKLEGLDQVVRAALGADAEELAEAD